MNSVAGPVGPPVDPAPAASPGPVVLAGRFGSVTRLDAACTGPDLWTALRGRDEVWTYLFDGPFAGQRSFAAWLAEREALQDPYYYCVCDAQGRAVGLVTLMSIRPQMRVIEVGNILYSPTLQRTPLATETQYLLARYVFETLGFRRYEWKCDALNAPSRRAACRYGFLFEGIFRQHMIVKARSRDTAWFAMLDRDWPTRKSSFERWLAPGNFERDGRQKRSLATMNQAQA